MTGLHRASSLPNRTPEARATADEYNGKIQTLIDGKNQVGHDPRHRFPKLWYTRQRSLPASPFLAHQRLPRPSASPCPSCPRAQLEEKLKTVEFSNIEKDKLAASAAAESQAADARAVALESALGQVSGCVEVKPYQVTLI